MTGELKDKVAVVTGGASGIGRSLCRAFAAEGSRVVVADIDTAGAKATLEVLDGAHQDHRVQELDVGSAASWDALHRKVKASYGRCDILCNNAGIMRVGAFAEADLGDWETQTRVNVIGIMLGCRAVLPMMLEQESGYIVNTASLAGLHPWPGGSIYAASKYAAVGFSESLREELAGSGVGVAVLCPGGVDTPMNDGFDTSGERLATPDEVARLVVDGIHRRRDWIFTHNEYEPMLDERHRAIIADHGPLKAAQDR